MRLKLILVAVVIILTLLLTGCMDDRIRRQISLLNVKTQTARDDFNSAPTPDEKNAVAQTYFSDAPAMTQALSDYAFKVQPAVVAVVPVKRVGRSWSTH